MRRTAAAALAGIALAVTAGLAPATAATTPDSSTPAAQLHTTTPIKHFMVLMQENHSFDNYFGTYPGADGIPAGTCMPNPKAGKGDCVKPFHVGGKAIVDLGHNAGVFKGEYDNGKLDGFVSAFDNQKGVGDLAMGYYDARDLPYYWNLADNYVLFDRLFTSAAGGSVWNHMFWVTGTPGNPNADALLPNGQSFDSVPTIFDRLQAAGVSWKFYVQNYKPDVTFRTPGTGDEGSQIVWVPPLDYNRFLDNPALHDRIVNMDQYYKDAADGTLPAVSFMVPSGASEHPPGSIQAGETFVRTLINTLMRSSAWSSSAFMWTYDDWGGWYDHVSPPKVDQWGYGFRSPALLVSPYAKKGYVDHTTLDFTSELKFIEANWGVAPLAKRDAAANNLTSAFDFSSPPRSAAVVSESRTTTPLPNTRQGIVYLSYGAAILVVPVFVVAATARKRRRVLRGAVA